jgi:hypothetical protein
MVILKWILSKYFGDVVLALCGPNLRLVAGCFEHGNEPVGSVTTGSFLTVEQSWGHLRAWILFLFVYLFIYLFIWFVGWLLACFGCLLFCLSLWAVGWFFRSYFLSFFGWLLVVKTSTVHFYWELRTQGLSHLVAAVRLWVKSETFNQASFVAVTLTFQFWKPNFI